MRFERCENAETGIMTVALYSFNVFNYIQLDAEQFSSIFG